MHQGPERDALRGLGPARAGRDADPRAGPGGRRRALRGADDIHVPESVEPRAGPHERHLCDDYGGAPGPRAARGRGPDRRNVRDPDRGAHLRDGGADVRNGGADLRNGRAFAATDRDGHFRNPRRLPPGVPGRRDDSAAARRLGATDGGRAQRARHERDRDARRAWYEQLPLARDLCGGRRRPAPPLEPVGDLWRLRRGGVPPARRRGVFVLSGAAVRPARLRHDH
mmetsp:Transcript_13031/g.37942  ORF Transcript_13031/g.37942 Transcript_13031/m.37942 type:complete len:226 (+) Transcript_13031:559-1236(+)